MGKALSFGADLLGFNACILLYQSHFIAEFRDEQILAAGIAAALWTWVKCWPASACDVWDIFELNGL